MGVVMFFFFFQAEDGIRIFCLSRGLGDPRRVDMVCFFGPIGVHISKLILAYGPGCLARFLASSSSTEHSGLTKDKLMNP